MTDQGLAAVVIFNSVLFGAFRCCRMYRSVGYRRDRISHARNAMMLSVYNRESL